MIGWFANSIMAGHDVATSKCTDEIDQLKAEKAELLEALGWLDVKFDCLDDGYGRAMFSRGDFKKVRVAIKKARERG